MLSALDADAPLTRDVAAYAVGVTVAVVTMWAHRGWRDPSTGEQRRLAVVDHDRRRRPRHRYGDVLAAERATRRSGKSHRRPIIAA